MFYALVITYYVQTGLEIIHHKNIMQIQKFQRVFVFLLSNFLFVFQTKKNLCLIT